MEIQLLSLSRVHMPGMVIKAELWDFSVLYRYIAQSWHIVCISHNWWATMETDNLLKLALLQQLPQSSRSCWGSLWADSPSTQWPQGLTCTAMPQFFQWTQDILIGQGGVEGQWRHNLHAAQGISWIAAASSKRSSVVSVPWGSSSYRATTSFTDV